MPRFPSLLSLDFVFLSASIFIQSKSPTSKASHTTTLDNLGKISQISQRHICFKCIWSHTPFSGTLLLVNMYTEAKNYCWNKILNRKNLYIYHFAWGVSQYLGLNVLALIVSNLSKANDFSEYLHNFSSCILSKFGRINCNKCICDGYFKLFYKINLLFSLSFYSSMLFF